MANNLPPIPEGWVFTRVPVEGVPYCEVGDLFIYIDREDPNERFVPGNYRFSIVSDESHSEPLLETDSWDEVLAFVRARGS